MITILYDNYSDKEGLLSAWGFALVLTGAPKTVLFDTGGDGQILLRNMRHLGFEPSGIDAVVVSHNHWDHKGGLFSLLQSGFRGEVYLPPSLFKGTAAQIAGLGSFPVLVEGPVEIAPGISSTGMLEGPVLEQSLLLPGLGGGTLVTGCAHPGVVTIIKRANAIAGMRVRTVIGGLHLKDHSGSRIGALARELQGMGVERISPCHCSGDAAGEILAQEFGAGYIEGKVGAEISLDG